MQKEQRKKRNKERFLNSYQLKKFKVINVTQDDIATVIAMTLIMIVSVLVVVFKVSVSEDVLIF